MGGAHGVVDLGLVDDDRDPDLRGGDHLDVDAGRGERREELRGDAGVGAHAGADQRDLADLVVVEQLVVADLVLDPRQRAHRGLAVGARQRERDVGEAGGGRRDVLHDHVDVDLGGGERLEDAGRLADLVGHADDGDLGLAAVVGDAGDDRLLHLFVSCLAVRDDPGAFLLGEGGAHVDRHVVAAGVLDAPQVQDLRARGRHLEHLLGGDPVELAGGRDDPRVGGEDAVDVGVDLADVGAERRGERDGRGVGGAAAERGDVLGVLRDALEAGDDRDRAVLDGRLDPARRDVDDLRLAVRGVGDHAGLRAGERLRLVAELRRSPSRPAPSRCARRR